MSDVADINFISLRAFFASHLSTGCENERSELVVEGCPNECA